MRPVGARSSRRIWYYQSHNAIKDESTVNQGQSTRKRNETVLIPAEAAV